MLECCNRTGGISELAITGLVLCVFSSTVSVPVSFVSCFVFQSTRSLVTDSDTGDNTESSNKYYIVMSRNKYYIVMC